MANIINTAEKASRVIANFSANYFSSGFRGGKTLLQEAFEYAFVSMKIKDEVENVLREWYADDSVLPDCNYYMGKIREIYDECKKEM